MHKLVIFTNSERIVNQEIHINKGFDTLELAVNRALRWLSYVPEDIIMHVEVKTSTCKHCDVPVEEKVGGVLHLWAHEGGYMACLPDGATQATPKEVRV